MREFIFAIDLLLISKLRDNIKILDCCAGNGNFPAYISLKTDVTNIWANEINPKRLTNLISYFEGKINIINKDFNDLVSYEFIEINDIDEILKNNDIKIITKEETY